MDKIGKIGMKTKELKGKTEKELQNLLVESREKLRQLKFDLMAKKVKNVMEIKKLRREIARILTILNQQKKNKEE